MGPGGQGTCAGQEGCLGHRTALSTENPGIASVIHSDNMNTGPRLGRFPERFLGCLSSPSLPGRAASSLASRLPSEHHLRERLWLHLPHLHPGCQPGEGAPPPAAASPPAATASRPPARLCPHLPGTCQPCSAHQR